MPNPITPQDQHSPHRPRSKSWDIEKGIHHDQDLERGEGSPKTPKPGYDAENPEPKSKPKP